MRRIHAILILCLIIGSPTTTNAQVKYTAPPLSSESNKGIEACPDTIFKFLFLKKVIELNLLLPAWRPVLGYDEITVLEGTVIPKPGSKHIDTHVSPSDFPFHHYTHDFSFNVKPDSTGDNRYTNLLANRVFRDEKSNNITDTVMMPYVHCEWESGLGAYNEGNPCSDLNNAGKSAGFYTGGHERRDRIWNWPTLGDWVHVEGLWLWDRGHPPARTEIHPARLVAVRRKLPDMIKSPGGNDIFATKIDIYASGDGGAFNNNRGDAPQFVRKVRMSNKDYNFQVKYIIPRPSPNAILKYIIKKQKGDTFEGEMEVTVHSEENNNDPYIIVKIPWKGKPDNLVFARTIYAYWDVENGKSLNYSIEAFKVTLQSLKFKKMKEVFGKSEFRVFLAVNGQYIFLNEFIDVPNILSGGLGSTRRRTWEINQEFIVYLPEGSNFRVHAGGWEADAIDGIMGTLMDQYSSCTNATKDWVHKNMLAATPFKSGGCLDDHIGEIHAVHTAQEVGDSKYFEAYSDGRKEIDFCPCNNGKQKNVFKLSYTIEKLNR